MIRQPRFSKNQQTQIIHDEHGSPIYVLIPYQEYIQHSLSHLPEAVRSNVLAGYTKARAWRDFLGLTQEELAQRLSISQSSYAQYERNRRLSSLIRRRIAKAMGIPEGDL
jgi:DNA-binding XRE family transcriptional regulator